MSDHMVLSPADVISDIHILAGNMGADRARVDRSQWEGDAGPWIEVGYAGREIHVRTSRSELVYRKHVDAVSMDDIIQLIEDLLDEEGPQ